MSMSQSQYSNRQPSTKDNNEKNGREYGIFGDKLNSNKNKKTTRVVFHNVRGFGYKKDQLKTESIKEVVLGTKADIYCMMAEINTSWKLISKQHTIKEVSRYWFERSTTSTAQNTFHHSKKQHQPGGEAILKGTYP